MLAFFISRVLGLVREQVIAYFFGASQTTDMYKAAFTIPDFFFYLIAGGALSTAFIPVFSEYFAKNDKKGAWEVFSIVATAMIIIASTFVIVGEIFAKQILSLMLPGFEEYRLNQTTSLTRIMLPAQFCFFLGSLMIAALMVHERPLSQALGPNIYNLGIILGGIIGGASLGPEAGVVGLCFGVVAGAFVGNLFLPIFQMVRLRASYKPSLKLRQPGVIKMGKLMLPILIGFSFPQVQMVITRFFGSYLPIRSITWLDNSSRVIQIPIGIFAQGLGVAIFPGLAALFASGKVSEYRERMELGLRAVLLLTIPATLFLWIFALPIVQAIYMHGRYQLEDAQATASAMSYYALGIFAISGVQLIVRGFYARQDTVTPIVIGTASTLAFIGLSWILIKSFGYRGLALASSISSILNFVLLLIAFESRGNVNRGDLVGTQHAVPLWLILKQLFASFIMAAACLPIRLWFNRLQQPLPLNWTLVELAIGVFVSGVVYLTIVKLMRLPEFDFIFGAVRQRMRL